jgi:hypothetical protein
MLKLHREKGKKLSDYAVRGTSRHPWDIGDIGANP